MGAFVATFDHDVFISYSHVDNLPLGPSKEEPGWVYTLADNLKTLLAQKLGRPEYVHLWIDRRLHPNLPFPKEIDQAARRSTLLVPIVSEGYLASDWCRQERELFVAANKDRGIEGRIFPLHKTEIDHTRLPEILQNLLGYPFYKKEQEDAPPRTLGMPVLDPKDPYYRHYFERLDDLSNDIARILRKMQNENGGQKPPSKEPPKKPENSGSEVELQSSGPAVLLAEVTPDLEEYRNNIRRHLEQDAVRVLPEMYYERAPRAYQEAMEKDLSRTTIFVQLLGQYVTPKTPHLPKGYEGLQLDLAKAAKVPILRWHHQDLDPNTVKDPELLASEAVMVMGLEDFKREIEKRLRLLSAKREPPPSGNGGFVLVDSKSSDLALAENIAKILDNMGVGYEIVDETVSLPDIAIEEDYDALLVIYGCCEPEWVQQQIRQCRQILLRKRNRPPVCGVFLGPAEQKPPLRIKPPKFYFIEEVTHPMFHEFVEAVQKRTALQ